MGSAEGKFDEGKGRAKEAAGDLTGNKNLQREGRADQVGGKIKQKAEQAKDKAGDAVDAVKDRFTKDR
ncbi:MAG TPA: CsbD family protein [Euzebya sp.]|nr:CsbD family protein [Euzebya sp.]